MVIGGLILRNHFHKPLKTSPPFDFHLEPGIVFYAAAIESAPALPPGAALRHRRPLGIQPPVKVPPTAAVIDKLRDLLGTGHG